MMLTSDLFVAVLFVGVPVLGAFILSRRNHPVLSTIPGPLLASFSSLWQIFYMLQGHGELKILDLHRRHGDFVRISHREVSSSHPDTMNAILRTTLRKGDWYQAMAVPDRHHNTPMSELDPKRHRERSTVTQAAFSLSWLTKSEAVVDECVSLFRKQLTKASRESKELHLDDWLNYLAFDIIGELIFSTNFGFLREGRDVEGSIKNIRFLMFYQSLMGYMYWMHDLLLATPLSSILGLRPMHHVFNVAKDAVEKRGSDKMHNPDMISLWKRNIAKHPAYMEEKELLAVAGMTIVAGSETMTGALGGVIYHLLKNPASLQKLQDELDLAAREGHISDIVTFQEAAALPYLQAVIKESLRYFPPVPFNLPRVAPKEGVRIGDQQFPEGTIISVSPLALQMNESIWGKDADSFKPERWLEPGAEQKLGQYICTFGAGYNGCPGRQFAIAEMSKIVAVLFRDFNIELADKSREWKYRNQFTVVQTDWPVVMTARNVRG